MIAITEENNRLFPNRPVSEGKIATSTGLMNMLSASVGGVPMCHGAGGMAGHVQFGARTGGAVVILGAVLLVIAIFFSNSVGTFLRLFPTSILGVILFLTGAQLALGACDISKDKGERFVLVIALNSFVGLATRFAAAAIDWGVVAAFLAGGVAGNTAAARLVPRLDQGQLKRIFAVFILLVGLFTAASASGLIPIRIK